jgi:hypothetical protein
MIPAAVLMIPAAVLIGDKWARRISIAFQEWAEQERPERTLKITPFDPEPFIEGAFYESGEAQLTELGKMLGMGVKFDLRSLEAEAWIKDYAAKEIKYIDASTRKTIQQITLRAFQEGLTPQEQSKLIRQYIGLLPQHVVAVQNYRDSLTDIDPALADNLEAKYRAKLLKWRADMIGLTEGHTASNQGYRQVNSDAVKRGVFSPDEWERYWMVTRDKRLCTRCEGMANKAASLPDGDFEGDGQGPPLHQRCRCTEGLRQK